MVRLGFAAEDGGGGGGGWLASVVLDGRKQEGKGEEIKDICFCKWFEFDLVFMGYFWFWGLRKCEERKGVSGF